MQNFLKSMQGTESLEGRISQTSNVAAITLLDLLLPSTTVPIIEAADESFLDNLLSRLPPEILNSPQNNNPRFLTEAGPDTQAEALSFNQKKVILEKVLRSPQFSQSVIALTGALRDGGLPAISDALDIPVENGGYTQTGGLAMGGNDATGAFMKGIKTYVESGQTKRSQANIK